MTEQVRGFIRGVAFRPGEDAEEWLWKQPPEGSELGRVILIETFGRLGIYRFIPSQ